MRKKRFLEIEVLAIFLVVIIIALSATFNHQQYRTDKKIIAFGDSLTAGYGVKPDKKFIVLLSAQIHIPIENAGISGTTTEMALDRLDKDVLSKHPDIVLVLLGGNDFLHNLSEDEAFINLRIIIRKIHDNGAKIILVGVSKEVLAEYENRYVQLAREEHVEGYVPDILGGIIWRSDMMHDKAHPNELGHQVMAARILPVLEKVLKEE